MTIRGVVQKGAARGRELGYPTANIPLGDSDISGIYAARVQIGEESPYIAAVFADNERHILEAHLLDFNDELYGLEIAVTLHKKIRERAAFTTDTDLKRTIAGDIESVRQYFASV